MKKVLATLVVAGGIVAGGVAGPVAADPVGICPPDGMTMTPVGAVPNGDKKDKNHNGLICAKFANNGTFNGGPDDSADDIIP